MNLRAVYICSIVPLPPGRYWSLYIATSYRLFSEEDGNLGFVHFVSMFQFLYKCLYRFSEDSICYGYHVWEAVRGSSGSGYVTMFGRW